MFAGGNLKVARILGIDILIHWSWLAIFFLLTWWLALGLYDELYPQWSDGERWTAAVVSSLLLFVSVLLHELSHSIMAIRRGIPVRSITLFIFGGVAALSEEPEKPKQEFEIAVVGPLTSFVLALVFGLLALLFGARDEKPAGAVLGYLAFINLILAAFNLLPGFPLDGGRLLRAALWSRSGDLVKATQRAAMAGATLSLVLMGFGVVSLLAGNFLGGIWFIVIGWFLRSAAEASHRQVVMKEALEGVALLSLVNRYVQSVPPATSVLELVQDYIEVHSQRAFPVMKGDELLGVVTLSDVRKLARERWPATSVADIMTPLEAIVQLTTADAASEALKLMTQRDVNQVAVVDDGRFVGFFSHSDLLRLLQIRSELAQPAR